MGKRSYMIVAIILAVIAASELYAEEPEVFKLGLMSSFIEPFTSVAETQKKGVLLKVGQINRSGGLNMPWGKAKVETVIKDDKADIPTGVALFKDMVGKDGIHALIGLTYNPLMAAINHECKTSPILFLPACVPASDSFRKGNPAEGMFSVAFTPWSIGYLAGGCTIKTLAKKNIYFLSRSDSWGGSTLEGLKKASETFGGKIVGVSETEKGTQDYIPVLNTVKTASPDAFLSCAFGSDAVMNLKQAHELGLYGKMLIFSTWITNVVASQIPDNALKDLYALTYYYYGLENFDDRELAKSAKKFTEDHIAMWKEPPDAYGAIAYMAADILFQAVEKAGSFEVGTVRGVIAKSHFSTIKGNVYFREDHQMVSKYMAFLVHGKAADEKKTTSDIFDVVGYFGGEESLPSLKSLGY